MMSRFPSPRGVILLVAVLVGALLATSAAPGWVPYRIKRGDSLWALAMRHHTTVSTLKRVNGLSGDLIIAGNLLSLPGPGVGTPPAGCSGGGAGGVSYRVRPGDNATVVASRFGVPLRTLARRNGLSGSMTIYSGQHLVIFGPRAASARPGSCATPPVATVKAMIRAEAARWRVDPALALAIGSVESAFNQAAVSSAGAVGIMQLMPRTATWLGQILGRPLNRRVAADNIAGGVAFLHFLLSAAPRTTAVAGYYQGLASVQVRGMFTDTRGYVANVLNRRRHYV